MQKLKPEQITIEFQCMIAVTTISVPLYFILSSANFDLSLYNCNTVSGFFNTLTIKKKAGLQERTYRPTILAPPVGLEPTTS